jgi:IgA-specific serine endopeptidase
MTDTITLAPISPSAPIVLCDGTFLSTLATVENRIAELRVTDADSAQVAADLQQRLTTAGRKLEAARAELKAPFIAKGREIDEAAKKPAARIDAAKGMLKVLLLDYAQEQEKIRRAAEEARQKELARLEALRVAEERAAQAKAAELAKQAAEAAAKSKAVVMDLDFDEPEAPVQKTETEKRIEAVQFAPAAVAARPSGIAFRESLRIVSADPEQLPEPFVVKTANMKAIRDTFCVGWKAGDAIPACAGVVFAVDKQAVSTGRSVF